MAASIKSGWYDYYRLDDSGNERGMIFTADDKLNYWNEKKWGIFHTIQNFGGNRRREENLQQIRCWAIDLDGKNKKELWWMIKQSPLAPTMIVETKNGFHVYWYTKGDATIENYATILDRLIWNFQKKDKWGNLVKLRNSKGQLKTIGADDNAKDLCRVLRTPKYYHWKDQNNPFLVKVIESREITYPESMMLHFFKPKPKKEVTVKIIRELSVEKVKSSSVGTKDLKSFWEKMNQLDCKWGLQMLSGSWAVAGEEYDFKPNQNGTFQIIVDGNSTGCWIDKEGKIGSSAQGVYTLSGWIRWFGHDWKKVYKAGREILNIK